MRGMYRDFYLDTVNSIGFLNCDLVENPVATKATLEAIISGERKQFSDGTEVWNSIQPYLWEQAFIRQSWK